MSGNWRIRPRGDTAANWTATNPVLLAREMGLETDTGKWKIGDGTTAWNGLGYFGGVLANAVTFAASGGAAPGTTFNGSVARTIDYSSVGAAKTGAVTGSGLTQTSARLLGRTTAATGAIEELTAAAAKTFLAISSGDVSGLAAIATSGSGADLTAASVTLAKLANIADQTILGNNTGGAAAPVALTAAQTRTVLGLAAIATSGSASDLSAGTLPAGRFPVLTGDVTTPGASLVTTIPTTVISTFMRTVTDDTSAAAARTTLGIAGGFTAIVTDRTALANLSTAHVGAYLKETGREGIFTWDSSNLSTSITADPGQGIYVPPASDTTGASGAWVRRYSGAKNAKWFGATGDGTTDDTTALQRWLDSGGSLLLPVAEYYSSAKLIVRKNITLDGQGYGFDARIVDGSATLGYDNQPGSRIRFAAAVGGLDIQPQTTVTDVATAVAAGLGGYTQEGASFSVIRNIALVGAGTGAAATGLYSRVVVYLDNVHVMKFQGKGFDLSASGNVPDGNSEYGGCNGATLHNCRAIYNGSHGYHIRGTDANDCIFTNCLAQLNGGWGFLDESALGNTYIGGDAATNTLGSYKCIGAVAASSYYGCYAETGTGQAPDLSYQCVVSGGILAGAAASVNVGSNGNPTIIAPTGINSQQLNLAPNQDEALTTANGHARVYRGANLGLALQGAPNVGGNYDVSLVNKNAVLALGITTGTTQVRIFGETAIDFQGLFFNGPSTWAGAFGSDGSARAFATAAGGLQLYGRGSGSDVSIGNKVGTIALRVPTNTTNVEIIGTASASNLSGTNTGDQFTATTASRLIGRGSSGAGAAQEITLGNGLGMFSTTLAGSFQAQAKTAGYSESATSGEVIAFCNLFGGFTVALPAASGNKARLTYKNFRSDGPITIAAAGTDTIDGASSIILSTQYAAVTLVSDDVSAWGVV